jgi:hypothetical protein
MLEAPTGISNPLVGSQCCLSSQETAQQVPETDIARLSFYLRCCVLGCGLANSRIPMELLNFTNAHSLPLEWQNMIYRLAFEDFGLCNLLGRVIHVDADNQVLPPGISTLFLQANTPEYALAMNRLCVATPHLSFLYTGNVMVCSSEWIEKHHILPFQRYIGNLASFLDCAQQTVEQTHQHQQQPFSQKKVEATVHFEYDDDNDQMDIPMVAAVPLESMQDDVSASLIVPGQQVRLFGLETDEMNETIGIVQERKDNRVIVSVPNHPCKYSVRIENLIIVQEAVAFCS